MASKRRPEPPGPSLRQRQQLRTGPLYLTLDTITGAVALANAISQWRLQPSCLNVSTFRGDLCRGRRHPQSKFVELSSPLPPSRNMLGRCFRKESIRGFPNVHALRFEAGKKRQMVSKSKISEDACRSFETLGGDIFVTSARFAHSVAAKVLSLVTLLPFRRSDVPMFRFPLSLERPRPHDLAMRQHSCRQTWPLQQTSCGDLHP